MTDSRLGVLLVAGKLTHQENYGPAFATDPRCRLVAVSDEQDVPPDREQWNRELARELDLPYVTDLAEALGQPAVDLVSVCAEPERRGRILSQCARAGKHLYIDKPMTPYLDAADAVVEAVARAGVRSQMFSFIHQPWAQRARRVLESGELGQLLALHADCFFAKGPAGTATLGQPRRATFPPRRFTFTDAKAELYAIGVYALGLVCWLAGRPVQTVYGRTANYFFEAHQRHGVEDFGLLALTFEDGLSATISGGRVGWRSHPAGGTTQVHLIGSRRSLLVDAHRPRLEVYDTAPPWTPPPINPRDPMGFWPSTQREVNTRPKQTLIPILNPTTGKSDASHFIDCILEGRESEINARAAAYLTEILLAGYQSAATGEVVTMPLPRA